MKKYLSVFGAASMIDAILKWYPFFLKENIPNATLVAPQQPSNLEKKSYYCIDIERKPNLIKDMYSLFKLMFFVRKQQFEFVHSFMPKAGFITAIVVLILRIMGRKITYVHTFTGLVWSGKVGVKQWLASRPDFFILSVADISVTESIGVANELMSLKQSVKPVILGCGNIAGVDLEYFKPIKKSNKYFEVNQSGISLLYIGRVSLDKGIFDLLSILDINESVNFKLTIVGGCELSPQDTSRFNNYLRIFSERITYIGFVEDVRPYLASADFFVFASKREGFPNVILQAMAMGIPVISSKVHGIEDILNTVNQQGEIGYFFDVGSHQGLADCILRASKTSEHDYLKMSELCVQLVASNFSKEIAYAGLKEFYQSLSVLDER